MPDHGVCMSPGVRERRVAAIVGALVADAAAQPIHWNYDTKKLDGLLSGDQAVVFREPSVNPFYNIPTGSQSCYGDQSFVILKSLVEKQGVDIEHLTKATYDWFGPNSVYENPVNAGYKVKTDLNKSQYPIQRPWRHSSIKEFIRKVNEGNKNTGSETDEQIDCTLRIVSVVALFAGSNDMLDKAEAVIRVTQNSDTSVAVGLAAARLLEYFILNGESCDAVDHVVKELSNPSRCNPQDLDRALAGFLRDVSKRRDKPHIETASCVINMVFVSVIPGAFQTAAHGVITGVNYQDGVEATLRAGGCNASRGGYIGACLAAQFGLSSIPDIWKQKTLRYKDISELAEKLVDIRPMQ